MPIFAMQESKNQAREHKFFSFPFTPTLFFLICFSLVLSLFAAGSVAADPTLSISGDLTVAGALEIGGDLEVAITGAIPGEKLTITLIDENGDRVVALPSLEADFAGEIAPTLLWSLTGVVGCDPGAVHDPGHYQFISIDEAKSILAGRAFWVQVAPAANPTKISDEVEIDLRATTSFVEGFSSDGAGCLRTLFDWTEDMHLAIRHQANIDLNLQISLVAAQDTWLPGDPIVDVRGAPQVVLVPSGINYEVALLWMAPLLAGDYQLIVQPVGAPDEFDADISLLIKPGSDVVGARSSDCGGVCPP